MKLEGTGAESLDNTSFLIVGTVSNCEPSLQKDYLKIFETLSQLGEVDTFLVESDSNDKTLKVLDNLAQNINRFKYYSAGKLKTKLPDRIERIRYCRNLYVNYIRDEGKVNRWDLVVVADLDGMNSAISVSGIKSSLLLLKKYDAIFANQTFGYYDIFALRCANWVESDVIKDLHNEIEKVQETIPKKNLIEYTKKFLVEDKIRKKFIYKKMRRITKSDKPIPVYSAFGGFGIYKAEIFMSNDYNPTKPDEVNVCEHLALHAHCLEKGYSLAINPRMINNHVNPYNLNRLFAVRLLRHLKKIWKKK